MRHLKSRAVTAVTKRVGTLNLRAYPNPNPAPPVPREVMTNELFAATLNARTETRRRFGRSISMDVIESALRQAYRGSMRSITDILRETVETDPHLGSILNKRFGAVANLPWDVQPASGHGVDKEKALFYAEVVRQQLRNMKTLRKNFAQLAWALFDGRSCLELQWVEVDPGVAPTDPGLGTPALAVQQMDWIHPRRISFGPQRELRIQPETVTTGGTFSDSGISTVDPRFADKFIFWTPQLFGEYPEREGLGIRCMYWSFFKRFAARERMILAELFGKPWRIVTVEEDSAAGDTELNDAEQIVDALGDTYTARMPRGTKLEVVSPAKSAGEVHQDIITESDKQNSKLVLGQTGTTDAVPAGLNSNQANVMQDEQLGVLIHDAGELAEVIESYLTDRIIAVNFGEAEVTHAPTFRLRADLPADRVAELSRLDAALQAGLAVSQAEAYDLSGFSVPDVDDVTIQMQQPPTPPNAPVAPAIRPMVVYPVGQSPDVGEQQPAAREANAEATPTPADGASADAGAASAESTVKVNEDRASRGLEPLTTEDGELDPRGEMTVKEFNESVVESGTDPDASTGEAAPSAEPAKQALNGSQLAAVLDIVQRYRSGELPRGSALELLVASFPYTSEQAERILGVEPDDAPAPGEAVPGPDASATVSIEPEQPPEDDTPPALGLSRIPSVIASNVAEEIAEGEMLYGEAGIHAHQMRRELETTEMDGDHSHVFKLPNGMFISTELDGAHAHVIPNADADTTLEDGAHTHAIVMGGQVMFSGDSISSHQHALQVDSTAVDGVHRHTLVVTDPDNPGQNTTIQSMTAGEFAAAIRDGSLPTMIDEQVPGTTAVGKKKRRVYGEHDITSEMSVAARMHREERAEWDAWVSQGHPVSIALAAGEADQFRTINGSPEDYVAKGMRELTIATGAWATEFENAVENESTPAGVFAALQRAGAAGSNAKFGRALERRKLQALMLGVVDNLAEITGLDEDAGADTIDAVVDASDDLATSVEELQDETSEQLDELIVAASKVLLAAPQDDFTKMPFAKAVQHFKSLNVLDRGAFELAQAAIKRRSFTVAGVMRDQMLRTLQDELVKSIQAGDDLRRFKKRIRPRLQQSGFMAQVGNLKTGAKALNASHVETVFRTNVLNTYNTGRYIHQTSPTVLAAFPVWELRGLRPTSPEDRQTHYAANGKMLMANDPFWLKAYAPYGYNCRCRVVARSRKYISQVIRGTAIQGLPDPGFTSGRPALALG